MNLESQTLTFFITPLSIIPPLFDFTWKIYFQYCFDVRCVWFLFLSHWCEDSYHWAPWIRLGNKINYELNRHILLLHVKNYDFIWLVSSPVSLPQFPGCCQQKIRESWIRNERQFIIHRKSSSQRISIVAPLPYIPIPLEHLWTSVLICRCYGLNFTPLLWWLQVWQLIIWFGFEWLILYHGSEKKFFVKYLFWFFTFNLCLPVQILLFKKTYKQGLLWWSSG